MRNLGIHLGNHCSFSQENKRKVDLYVKDSEIKVIDSKDGTTRIRWKWKTEIKGKLGSKILEWIGSKNQVFD